MLYHINIGDTKHTNYIFNFPDWLKKINEFSLNYVLKNIFKILSLETSRLSLN